MTHTAVDQGELPSGLESLLWIEAIIEATVDGDRVAVEQTVKCFVSIIGSGEVLPKILSKMVDLGPFLWIYLWKSLKQVEIINLGICFYVELLL